MMKVNKRYIWDYERVNLKNTKVLLWYLKRKIETGDWESLDRKTLKKYLPKISINPYLKKILLGFIKKYG